MTPLSDQQVLEQVISITIENGWQHKTPDDASRIRNDDPVADVIEYWDLDWHEWPDAYMHILFDLKFARCLFGEEHTWLFKDWPEKAVEKMQSLEGYTYLLKDYQHHLQQLVIAENRLDYLRRWLEQRKEQ